MQRPFAKLKKLKLKTKEPSRSVSKKNSSPVQEQDEVQLFLEAVQDVKPLHKKGPEVISPAKPVTSPQKKEESLEKFLRGDFEFELEYTEEYMQGIVKGVNARVFAKLKTGGFSVERHLDLHGFTLEQAHLALIDFIRACYLQNKRCVLIITGRGLNSPLGVGVLKREIQYWLTRDPLKRIVLAFCTALPKHGGAGALYVLLRNYKKTKGKISWERIFYP